MLSNSTEFSEPWVKSELSSVNFGDKRLDERFWFLSQELSKHPSQSINQASANWAAAKAAYRFFDNPKVSPEKILEPHYASTIDRIFEQERVVVVQDTSYFNFTSHPKTKGLGPISKSPKTGFEQQGICLHTSLALTTQGLPLGLVDQQMWVRDGIKCNRKKLGNYKTNILPIEQKESFKWIKSLRRTAIKTKDIPVIMVADREADIFEFFDESLDYGVDILVRLRNDRILCDEDLDYVHVSEKLNFEEIKSVIEIEVPGSGKRQSRQAILEMKYTPITLSAHGRGINTVRNKNHHDLELFIIELKEKNAPENTEDLHWILITTLEIKNQKQALEVIKFYKMRWMVEVYFKTLKTGCNIESCRLEEAIKLENYMALLSIIAWRILWMTFINRINPNASCESVLTKSEWQSLWIMKNKLSIKLKEIKPIPPKEAPNVHTALRWLASLGGFLARKSDGEPGMIAIWRGWLELTSAVIMYEALSPHLQN